jgi:AcrR family transcriptional regulator
MSARRPSRPRRGTPQATRARLVAAAAEIFNRDGYHGTDSNALARAAGYSPGTFYRHFPDKRAVFLAAYQAWVATEWDEIGRLVADQQPASRRPAAAAVTVVGWVVGHHRRWRRLRASLRGLAGEDEETRAFYLQQRRWQLDSMARLRPSPRARRRRREQDAVLLYTMERVCDAIADGELDALGLDERRTVALLERLVTAHLGG